MAHEISFDQQTLPEVPRPNIKISDALSHPVYGIPDFTVSGDAVARYLLAGGAQPEEVERTNVFFSAALLGPVIAGMRGSYTLVGARPRVSVYPRLILNEIRHQKSETPIEDLFETQMRKTLAHELTHRLEDLRPEAAAHKRKLLKDAGSILVGVPAAAIGTVIGSTMLGAYLEGHSYISETAEAIGTSVVDFGVLMAGGLLGMRALQKIQDRHHGEEAHEAGMNAPKELIMFNRTASA